MVGGIGPALFVVRMRRFLLYTWPCVSDPARKTNRSMQAGPFFVHGDIRVYTKSSQPPDHWVRPIGASHGHTPRKLPSFSDAIFRFIAVARSFWAFFAHARSYRITKNVRYVKIIFVFLSENFLKTLCNTTRHFFCLLSPFPESSCT